MASANIKDVKRRIKSVESTMQITKAMELVASSKLRRAKERAAQSRPYFNTLYETIKNISKDNAFKGISKSLKERHALMIVIAGDRGLAGGFNHNVLKMAVEKIKALEADGYKVSVMPVGKKAVEYFRRYNYPVFREYQQVAETITAYDCIELSEELVLKYTRGEFGIVELCYTTFVNTLSQLPKSVRILPLSIDDNTGDTKEEKSNEPESEGKKYSASVLYDPSPEEVFELLLPKYFAGIYYGAVVDSYAAEQAARRTAMESASDNAQEMIDNLSLLYNRARQAQITQELTEIVSGSIKNSD